MLLQLDLKPESPPGEIIGDPFVDTGLLAIELMTKKPFNTCTPEDLKLVPTL